MLQADSRPWQLILCSHSRLACSIYRNRQTRLALSCNQDSMVYSRVCRLSSSHRLNGLAPGRQCLSTACSSAGWLQSPKQTDGPSAHIRSLPEVAPNAGHHSKPRGTAESRESAHVRAIEILYSSSGSSHVQAQAHATRVSDMNERNLRPTGWIQCLLNFLPIPGLLHLVSDTESFFSDATI